MAQYDLYNIEQRLNEIDPRFIRIDFDEKRALHRIVAVDRYGIEYIAWTVPWGQLDARQLHEAYRINPERYNVMNELRKMEERKEHRSNQKITDMATDMAENLLSSFRFSPRRSIE